MDSCVGDTISILMWDGASASAPRIGVSVAEGALAGLVGAAKRAALLSAEGPRGVLEESALGPKRLLRGFNVNALQGPAGQAEVESADEGAEV
jgi:hypothetical protein